MNELLCAILDLVGVVCVDGFGEYLVSFLLGELLGDFLEVLNSVIVLCESRLDGPLLCCRWEMTVLLDSKLDGPLPVVLFELIVLVLCDSILEGPLLSKLDLIFEKLDVSDLHSDIAYVSEFSRMDPLTASVLGFVLTSPTTLFSFGVDVTC